MQKNQGSEKFLQMMTTGTVYNTCTYSYIRIRGFVKVVTITEVAFFTNVPQPQQDGAISTLLSSAVRGGQFFEGPDS